MGLKERFAARGAARPPFRFRPTPATPAMRQSLPFKARHGPSKSGMPALGGKRTFDKGRVYGTGSLVRVLQRYMRRGARAADARLPQPYPSGADGYAVQLSRQKRSGLSD